MSNATDQVLPSDPRTVCVIGGSGFLGARIARAFAVGGHQVVVVARQPDRVPADLRGDRFTARKADIGDAEALRRALEAADIVVNAVSLYTERGSATFRSIHVEGAARLAQTARRAGVEALVHISGIGASRQARDPYCRARGEGEDAVRHAFPGAVILRPSAMFAAEGGFLHTLSELVRTMPVLPLFGRGTTRLQPVHADDVAKAAVCAALRRDLHGQVHFAAGPTIYTYRELLDLIIRQSGSRTILMPYPFTLWHATAAIAERLPGAPVTRAQVALMEHDNVAGQSGIFAACGIERQGVESTIRAITAARR